MSLRFFVLGRFSAEIPSPYNGSPHMLLIKCLIPCLLRHWHNNCAFDFAQYRQADRIARQVTASHAPIPPSWDGPLQAKIVQHHVWWANLHQRLGDLVPEPEPIPAASHQGQDRSEDVPLTVELASQWLPRWHWDTPRAARKSRGGVLLPKVGNSVLLVGWVTLLTFLQGCRWLSSPENATSIIEIAFTFHFVSFVSAVMMRFQRLMPSLRDFERCSTSFAFGLTSNSSLQ